MFKKSEALDFRIYFKERTSFPLKFSILFPRMAVHNDKKLSTPFFCCDPKPTHLVSKRKVQTNELESFHHLHFTF